MKYLIGISFLLMSYYATAQYRDYIYYNEVESNDTCEGVAVWVDSLEVKAELAVRILSITTDDKSRVITYNIEFFTQQNRKRISPKRLLKFINDCEELDIPFPDRY